MANVSPFRRTGAGGSSAFAFFAAVRRDCAEAVVRSANAFDASTRSGRTSGLASAQCVPGGIGSTTRSSRMLPPAVLLGNHHGVPPRATSPVSPARIRRCQKMWTRGDPLGPFRSPPARNASGTNPIASQNRLAAMSCAHQQQYSLHP